MKNLLLLVSCICLMPSGILAQAISINTDGSSADSSAILDIKSTDKGILVPRMTSSQRTMINTPAMGLLVYDVDTEGFWFFNGMTWRDLSTHGPMSDMDGDTRVQVEESADEDMIRFDVSGSEAMVIDTLGRVGIGIDAPATRLHISNGGLLITDTIGNTPVSGAGARMMWIPAKKAFRAGDVTGTQWDNNSIGMQSFVAGGLNNTALAETSFVGGGYNNTASGLYSFVGGGSGNVASAQRSFVGGGETNIASGMSAFVGGGDNNKATGVYSYVGGGQSNTASGARSFVGSGGLSVATGHNSFIGGGWKNTASGLFSFIGGGRGLMAESHAEVVIGSYNTDYTPASYISFVSTDRLFVIGNGLDSVSRSNAVTVLKNGNVGIGIDNPIARLAVRNGAVLFDGTSGSTPITGAGTRMMWIPAKKAFRAGEVSGTQWNDAFIGEHSFVAGKDNMASGVKSFAGGGQNNIVSGNNACIVGGDLNTASGTNSFVGSGFGNLASSTWAFVGGGLNDTASALGAFVGGGYDNTARGPSAFVGGGEVNDASGFYAFIGGGLNNVASASSAFVAGGYHNTSSANDAFIGGGLFNRTSGKGSFTGGGIGLLAKSYGEAVVGSYNTDYIALSTTSFELNDRLFVIGNGVDSLNRSNALTILKNGRVGIGTETPAALLTVNNGAVHFNGTSGNTPVSGSGTRMMWIPSKKAFRAGEVTSAQWDNTSIGNHSFVAGGLNNEASGDKSFAGGGRDNIVSGANSFVGGGTENVASGLNSFTGGGKGLYARSYSEVALGMYCTDYAPQSTSGYDPDDRLLVIGNGSYSADRKNAMIILKNGNIGIGTSTPGESLHIASGNLRVDGGEIQSWGPIVFHPDVDNGGDDVIKFLNSSGGETMRISESGLVGIGRVPMFNKLEVEGDASKSAPGNWIGNSDERLKTNIQVLNAQDILQKVLRLEGITYEWNDTTTSSLRPEGIQYGFTAQNIQEVFPELVSEDALGFLQTAYGTYDAMLVEAMRALHEALTEQQQLNAQLSGEVSTLNQYVQDIESRLEALGF